MINLPSHTNPTQADRIATAPYNFVPLPEKVVTAVADATELPDQDSYANPLYPHTGYFDVYLTTKSPLYIRGMLTEDLFKKDQRKEDPDTSKTNDTKLVKNQPDFFHIQDTKDPVIPGSSLRGMLRALLEIVSYGKLARERVGDRQLVYRAVGDTTALGTWYRQQMLGSNQVTAGPDMRFEYPLPEIRGGYLCRHGRGWGIHPARADATTFNESFIHVDYRNTVEVTGKNYGRQKTYPVYVQPAVRNWSNRGPRGPGNLHLNLAVTPKPLQSRTSHGTAPVGMLPAVLVESGHVGNPPATGNHAKHMHCAVYEKDLTAPIILIPQKLWELYEEDRELSRGLPTRKLEKSDDVLFYLLDATGNLVFFGPTMMFRLPYKNHILDRLPAELRNPFAIDYADAIFGYVRSKAELGNIEVPQGDKRRAWASRVMVSDAVLEHTPAQGLWLQSEPLTPHILSSPKPTSFQHYLVQPQVDRPNLSHWDSSTTDSTGSVLRGHKRYWLQGDRTAKQLHATKDEQQHNTQLTQMMPVRSAVEFRFRVYFENLSDRELGAMCWTLHPRGEPGENYCHQIGMGKALGMGMVSLKATLHLTRRTQRYTTLFHGNEWNTGADGPGQLLTDRDVLDRLTTSFEDHLLEELNPPLKCLNLYQMRRIAFLLRMMDSVNLLTENHIRQMDLDQYRQRPVLPDPSAFGHIAGNFVPRALDVNPRWTPPPASFDYIQGRIWKRICISNGIDQVEQLNLLVENIRTLPEQEKCIQCVTALKQRLRGEFRNLWKKSHREKMPWRNELEKLLPDNALN